MSDFKVYAKNAKWISEIDGLKAAFSSREDAIKLARNHIKADLKRGIKSKIFVRSADGIWVDVDG